MLVAVAGFATGAGVSLAVSMLYSALRGRDGLGFGDVRLLGAMGLVLGPYVLLAYALANVIGVLVAVPQSLLAHTSERFSTRSIPFGPFLAVAGVATALWGPALWSWYLHLLGVA
jgi:leader peptidase (prepilin peptidase)/N-methyltransferase